MPQWLHTRVARKEDPRDLNSFENSRFGAMTVYHCLFTGGVCGDPCKEGSEKLGVFAHCLPS